MKLNYEDIHLMARQLGLQPRWYGIHGEPRFFPFTPNLATVYGDQCALATIECQNCHTQFLVAADWRRNDSIVNPSHPNPDLFTQFTEGTWDYGDPPADCCAVGSTMSSEPIGLVEMWTRDGIRGWVQLDPTPPFTLPDWLKKELVIEKLSNHLEKP